MDENIEKKIEEKVEEKREEKQEDMSAIKEAVEMTIQKMVEASLKDVNARLPVKEAKAEVDNWQKSFVEALRDLRDGKIKAIDSSNVGAVIIPEFTKQTFKIAADYGAILKGKPNLVPPSLVVNIPYEGTGWTFSYVAEGGTITPSSPTYPKYQIALANAKAMGEIPNETINDCIAHGTYAQLTNHLAYLAGKALGAKVDDEGFNGTGSSPHAFEGIFVISGTTVIQFGSGKTSFSDLGYNHLTKAVSYVKSAVAGNCAWYTNRQNLQYIMGIEDNNGRPIFDFREDKLLGYPINYTDAITSTDGADTPFIAFGSVKDGVALSLPPMRMDESPHFYFDKDALALRMVQPHIQKIVEPSDWVIIKTAAS